MDQSDTLNPPTSTVRHDGWTPRRKALFLDHLANHGDVRAACRAAGMSREAAYRLRRRDAVFARAWAAGLALAGEAAGELLACRAINGVEEEVWHAGRMVGTRIRFDTRLLLAHLARLDRMAECETAQEDAARFDELVAMAAGEAPPAEGLIEDDDGVPLPRETCINVAVKVAGEVAREAAMSALPETDDDDFDEDDEAALEAVDEQVETAHWRAGAETAALFDDWLDRAHAAVDRLLADEAPLCAGTLSTVSTSPLAHAAAHGQPYA